MIRRELQPAMAGSLLMHAIIALALMISWSLGRQLKAGAIVPVTIVSRAPDADVRPAQQAPVEQTAQTEEPVPEAPPQAAPPPQKAPPPAPKPTPAPKVVEPKPAPAPAKPTPAKPEKSLDLDALSASISKMSKSAPPKPSSAAKGPARPETAPVARDAPGKGVSALAMSGLVAELQRHWNPNCDVTGARDVRLKVTFSVQPNGSVLPDSVTAGGAERSTNPVVRAAADRAIRSVYEVAALRRITPDFYGERVSANYSGSEACS